AALIDGLDGGKDRLWFHDHTCSPAIRVIIDDVMFICGGIANIMQGDAKQPTLLSVFEDAFCQRSLEHAREECKNIKMHRCSLFHMCVTIASLLLSGKSFLLVMPI